MKFDCDVDNNFVYQHTLYYVYGLAVRSCPVVP